jgi:hypothetical protein
MTTSSSVPTSKSSSRIKWFVALALFAASAAHGSMGDFDPDQHEYTGPQLITFVDSHSASSRCIGLASEIGDYAGAVLGMVAPMAACADASKINCTIIAPISAGPGQLFAAVAAHASPDEVLGHEFRHCRDHDYHPVLQPNAKA